MAGSRQSIVDDRELQELYNQVLAGFADESPTEAVPKASVASGVHNNLSSNGPQHRPQPARIPTTTAATATTAGPSVSSNHRPLSSGSHSPSSSLLSSPKNPSSSRRQLANTSSPSSSPMSHSPQVSRRPLPPVPGSSPSYSPPDDTGRDGRRPNGIPSSPKDPRGIPPSSSSRPATASSAASSHRTNPSYPMPVPDPAPAYPHRTPSYRPPGAGAARIPANGDLLEDPVAAHNTPPPPPPPPPPLQHQSSSTTSSSSSPYFPFDVKESQLYRPKPSAPAHAPASTLAPPPDLRSTASSDDILALGKTGVVRRISNESSASSGFTRSSLSRNQTTSTVSSTTSWGAQTAGTPDTSEYGDPAAYTTRYSNGSNSSAQYHNSNNKSPSPGPSHASSFSGNGYAPPPVQVNGGYVSSSPGPNGSGSYHPHSHRSAPSEASTARPAPSRLANEIVITMKGREAFGIGLPGGSGAGPSGYNGSAGIDDDDELEGISELSDDDGFASFANFAPLSNIAVWLRDEVPRGTHVKDDGITADSAQKYRRRLGVYS